MSDSDHASIRDPQEITHRERFLDEVNAAYAALKADPDAWHEYIDERREWDSTLADGPDDE